MTLSRARTQRACALGSWGSVHTRLIESTENKTYTKGNTLKVPGKGNSLFFLQNVLKLTQNITASSAEALWFSRCFILREHLLDTESTKDAAGWGRLIIFQGEKEERELQISVTLKIIIIKTTKKQTADIL